MKKITDTIRFIEENLHEDISVESIAAASGYSRFHFQRLFAHCVGVNVGYYINQRRLMKAAIALAKTDMRIIDIAYMVRFESQEAFTRAFKKFFGKTPARYRKDKSLPILKSFPAFNKDIVRHLDRHKELRTPRFIHKKAMAFIGFSTAVHRGAEGDVVQNVWKTMAQRSAEIQNKTDDTSAPPTSYGVL